MGALPLPASFFYIAQVSSGDCPHLLFYGPPGAGKKTLIIGLLRQIYGPAVEKVRSPRSRILALAWPSSPLTML